MPIIRSLSTPGTLCTQSHFHRGPPLTWPTPSTIPSHDYPFSTPTHGTTDRLQEIPISPRSKGRCAGSRLFLPRTSNGLHFLSTAESARSCSILYVVTLNRQAWQDRPGQDRLAYLIMQVRVQALPLRPFPFSFSFSFLPPVPILHPALLRIVQCDLSTCFTIGYRC